jgi:hypothetical protein
MAAARFAGLMRVRITFLGFRASALHPRLYSAARIRGLKMRTSIWRKSLDNDKYSTPATIQIVLLDCYGQQGL